MRPKRRDKSIARKCINTASAIYYLLHTRVSFSNLSSIAAIMCRRNMHYARPVGGSRASRISVVIPCYKYGHYLEEAVASALDQDNVDVDVLIVDDASPDGSANVAKSIAARDERVSVLVNERNIGNILTYNRGLSAVNGEYIVLLSADDMLARNSLTRAAALMNAHPEIGFVYGSVKVFSHEPEQEEHCEDSFNWVVWEGKSWAAKLYNLSQNVIYSPEVVVRASTLDQVGLYDSEHPHAGDLQMWLRLAAVADVGFLAGATQAYYRKHALNMHSVVFGLDKAKGMITDLRHRREAFETAALRFPDPNAFIALVRHSLAVEAINLASRAYVWGLTETWPVTELVEFARDCNSDIINTRAGRAYRRRAHLGATFSRRNPFFVLRELWLNRSERIRANRSAVVGVPE